MKPLLFALVFLVAGAAQAQTVVIECAPINQMSQPLKIGWDQVNQITSMTSTANVITGVIVTQMKSRILLQGETQEDDSTNLFKSIYSENGLVLTPDHHKWALAYDAVVLDLTQVKFSPTAGPVHPGTYDATAALVLVASHPQGRGLAKAVDTRSIDLKCTYTASYGIFQ